MKIACSRQTCTGRTGGRTDIVTPWALSEPKIHRKINIFPGGFYLFHLWVLDRSWECMHLKLESFAMHHKNVSSATRNSFFRIYFLKYDIDLYSIEFRINNFDIKSHYCITSFQKIKDRNKLCFWNPSVNDLFLSYISISECPGLLSKLVTLSRAPPDVSCPPGPLVVTTGDQHQPGDPGCCILSW